LGRSGTKVGTASELRDYFGDLAARGVERVYAWFSDLAAPATLKEFGDEVIRPTVGN
jgi:hypothetical protein